MATYIVRKNNVISMVRGDTFKFDVTITDEGSSEGIYILSNQDILYFALMEPNKNFEDSILVKEYEAGVTPINEDGSITITLDADDTLNLFPGKYYYTIKLNKLKKADSEDDSSGEDIDEIITVIAKTEFFILD